MPKYARVFSTYHVRPETQASFASGEAPCSITVLKQEGSVLWPNTLGTTEALGPVCLSGNWTQLGSKIFGQYVGRLTAGKHAEAMQSSRAPPTGGCYALSVKSSPGSIMTGKYMTRCALKVCCMAAKSQASFFSVTCEGMFVIQGSVSFSFFTLVYISDHLHCTGETLGISTIR